MSKKYELSDHKVKVQEIATAEVLNVLAPKLIRNKSVKIEKDSR